MTGGRTRPLFEGSSSFTPDALLGPLTEIERVNAPRELWISGDANLLGATRRIAIVGSRRASRDGLAVAAQLATELCERGFVVVSGLAEGIDTAAHEAAIAARGRTIAVLGTPLDRVYPAKNRALQDLIARDHLVVSQFAPGSEVRRGNFIRRNRTMALLVDGSIIVEASETSGSLSQGWEALRLGRQLFLLESVARRSDLAWPKRMMEYGAAPIRGTVDILDAIPPAAGYAVVEAPF